MGTHPIFESDFDCLTEMEKVRTWSTEMTVGRDKSHSIEHFSRVESFIQQIIQDKNIKAELVKINSKCFEAEKILYSAAWLHDIFDHKYTTEKEAEAGQFKIKSFLENISFYPEEIEAIREICENVSYSKEKKGKLKKLEYPINYLRDIVSDADKLDAIGYAGIERCRDFSKYRAPNASCEEIEANVVEHMHDKLLKLLDQFIRTDPAKFIGEPLQKEMLQYLENK